MIVNEYAPSVLLVSISKRQVDIFGNNLCKIFAKKDAKVLPISNKVVLLHPLIRSGM